MLLCCCHFTRKFCISFSIMPLAKDHSNCLKTATKWTGEMRGTNCDVVVQEEKKSEKHLACTGASAFTGFYMVERRGRNNLTPEDEEVPELYLVRKKERRERSLKPRQYLNMKTLFWITKENVLFYHYSKVSETDLVSSLFYLILNGGGCL